MSHRSHQREREKKLRDTNKELRAEISRLEKENRTLRNEIENLQKPVRPRVKPPTAEEKRQQFLDELKRTRRK